MKKSLKKLKEKGVWEGEILNKRKDGIEFISWVKTTGLIDKKENILNYISIQHEVTEQKRLK
tara:strand:- start:1196 stop:1381 length:186 start_codon:yes stop_codon:yes gene_type:complete